MSQNNLPSGPLSHQPTDRRDWSWKECPRDLHLSDLYKDGKILSGPYKSDLLLSLALHMRHHFLLLCSIGSDCSYILHHLYHKWSTVSKWQCETTGVDNPENSCDRLRNLFEALTYPGLTSISYILLGIFPAVNLILAVNVKEIKQKFKTWFGRAAIFYPIEEQSATSTATATSTLRKE